MVFKGAVFDLDGTLFDTEELQYMGWVEVLKEYGKTVFREEYIRDCVGKNGAMIERELIARLGLDVKHGELLRKKEALLSKWLSTKPIGLMPYASETVRFFSEQKIPVAVASGAGREETMLKLRVTGFDSLFRKDCIVTSDDVEKGKPGPDTYIAAAGRLGLKPEDCVAFEDTEAGVAAAKGAGMMCIVIPNGFTKDMSFSEADIVFDSLEEAVGWVRKKQESPEGA